MVTGNTHKTTGDTVVFTWMNMNNITPRLISDINYIYIIKQRRILGKFGFHVWIIVQCTYIHTLNMIGTHQFPRASKIIYNNRYTFTAVTSFQTYIKNRCLLSSIIFYIIALAHEKRNFIDSVFQDMPTNYTREESVESGHHINNLNDWPWFKSWKGE